MEREREDRFAKARIDRIADRFEPGDVVRFKPTAKNGIGAEGFGRIEPDGRFTVLAATALSDRVCTKPPVTWDERKLLKEGQIDSDGRTTTDVTLVSLFAATDAICGAHVVHAKRLWQRATMEDVLNHQAKFKEDDEDFDAEDDDATDDTGGEDDADVAGEDEDDDGTSDDKNGLRSIKGGKS